MEHEIGACRLLFTGSKPCNIEPTFRITADGFPAADKVTVLNAEQA